ncbi:F-box and WD repeat domain containing protein 10B-like [Polymixia lowei]
MKHVERRMFVSEREFRCKRRDDEFNTCGSCLTCIYTTKLSESTEWLSRVGDSSKRKFLIGLLVRCRSVRLLQSIQNVLRVTSGKDYTYTRSKKPSLPEDTVTCSSDRALDRNLLAIEMVETWDWFSRSHDWIKSNYLLAVLSLCNTELLRMLSNLTSVLLVREKQAFLHLNATGDTENEVSSIPESTYSFCSQDHPHLDLLMQASSVFEPVDLCSDMNTDMDRSTAQPETCLTLGLCEC